MKQRCDNPNDVGYKNYGGRGIKFRYESFSAFINDVGLRPEGMSIERKDNNGHYEKGNCRWAFRSEQSNNTRRNLFFILEGVRFSLKELCLMIGAKYRLVYDRIHTLRWSITAALETDMAITPA
jgi:hypothetical protein